jgi:hypothetical protein
MVILLSNMARWEITMEENHLPPIFQHAKLEYQMVQKHQNRT